MRGAKIFSVFDLRSGYWQVLLHEKARKYTAFRTRRGLFLFLVLPLPRNIEYLIKETYNWFSHSTLRQAQYKNLYNAINNGHNPLKIVKACDTRWLSIETAVSRILQQWIELKTIFQIARQKEKCYNAEILFNMYSDNNNLAYLVLLEIQIVNKSF